MCSTLWWNISHQHFHCNWDPRYMTCTMSCIVMELGPISHSVLLPFPHHHRYLLSYSWTGPRSLVALGTSGRCLAASLVSSPRTTLTSTRTTLAREAMESWSCACGRTVTVATGNWWLCSETRIYAWTSWPHKSNPISLLCSEYCMFVIMCVHPSTVSPSLGVVWLLILQFSLLIFLRIISLCICLSVVKLYIYCTVFLYHVLLKPV